MTGKITPISPVIFALYKPDVSVDDRGNRRIKSIARVYFPKMKELASLAKDLKKESLIGLKPVWKTVDDRMNAAKSIILTTGIYAAMKFAEEESCPSLDLSDSSLSISDDIDNQTTTSEPPETVPSFYPTMLTLSGTTLTESGKIPVVQSTLEIRQVGEDDLIPMARSLLRENPEMEIHFIHDNIDAVIDFMTTEINKVRPENSQTLDPPNTQHKEAAAPGPSLSDSTSSIGSIPYTITENYYGRVKDSQAKD